MKSNQKKQDNVMPFPAEKAGKKPGTFHEAMKYLADQADKKVKERQKASK